MTKFPSLKRTFNTFYIAFFLSENELTQDTSRMQDSFDDHEDESAILVLDPDHVSFIYSIACID